MKGRVNATPWGPVACIRAHLVAGFWCQVDAEAA